MSERWIVNASPLITLARSGHLDILEGPDRDLFLPQAVAAEVLAGPRGDLGTVTPRSMLVRDA